MDWQSPLERYQLMEKVGRDEYNRQVQKYHTDGILEVVNGLEIRPVGTRFGRLFQVDGTNRAFFTLEEARDFAKEQHDK